MQSRHHGDARVGGENSRRGDFPARVHVVLGPTNTGKTHLAMERLLAHSSGMIGFPLRLLARENYERMVKAEGVGAVGLITGEEKIVPPGARWFSCTVEAMPLDRPVEFLAVDEIQLAADPDRGHIFTARLLGARGLGETLFLGAETIRPLIQLLVPGIEIETRPRLSQLSAAGAIKLMRLPPRSAVVAFSAAELYGIAEIIRHRRGGAALVMGRMSPRTRNAQVALYQNKEVDFLVATDAIGMGLNMDVDHVAFAGLTKFDGRGSRPLNAAELAQIAGRAGRGARDGSFGTTGESPPLAASDIEAIEQHRFPALSFLTWRNDALDFSSLEALLGSLATPPPGRGLIRGPEADDARTLAELAREPEIADLARGTARLRLLWQVCQIPDFQKLADHSHTRLAGDIFRHLAASGRLPTDRIARSIEELRRPDGDIDTLMQRLAAMRVWSYVAARSDWMKDAAHWQARSREVEDLLSDALHERLTQRFVDRRSAGLVRKLENGGAALLSAVNAAGEVTVEGHAMGHIAGFHFIPDPAAEGEEKKLLLRAARRALGAEWPRRVARFAAAPDEQLRWHDDHRILWEGAAVARLRPGRSLLAPEVEALPADGLAPHELHLIRDRAAAFVRGAIERDLAALLRLERHVGAKSPALAPLRGAVYLLLGAAGVRPHGEEPPVAVHPALRGLGIAAGRFALFMPALLKPAAMARRAALLALAEGLPRTPALPPQAPVHLAAGALTAGFAARLGYIALGPKLMRLDMAERLGAELSAAHEARPAPLPADLAARLGVRRADLPGALAALGIGFIAAQPVPYGPPAPAMHRRRHRGKVAAPRLPLPDNPFAVLRGRAP